MSRENNQSGFSAVGAILALAIVTLLVVVGWLIYKDHHKTPVTNTSHVSKTMTTAPTAITASATTNLVTTFYNQYMACFNSGNANGDCTSNLVKQYGTANLYTYYKPSNGSYPADPIMCAQDNPPSFTVSDVTTARNSAAGEVTENFSTPSIIKFTVINQSGVLKIDSITCNPPLVASQGSL